jgi:hypothetical protein
METRKIEILSFIDGFITCLECYLSQLDKSEHFAIALSKAITKYEKLPVYRTVLSEIIEEFK